MKMGMKIETRARGRLLTGTIHILNEEVCRLPPSSQTHGIFVGRFYSLPSHSKIRATHRDPLLSYFHCFRETCWSLDELRQGRSPPKSPPWMKKIHTKKEFRSATSPLCPCMPANIVSSWDITIYNCAPIQTNIYQTYSKGADCPVYNPIQRRIQRFVAILKASQIQYHWINRRFFFNSYDWKPFSGEGKNEVNSALMGEMLERKPSKYLTVPNNNTPKLPLICMYALSVQVPYFRN
ncbi:uncharacterized protein BDR25DRAFT_363572 [Lindgomyces ingoldianus]|uniref:Uncharacterized protein n=1 Tax=Lindgomyces ingoldianus TaxID=673940 RepID=A0ACB6Q879_9PLEO|nr:uncharacterized protein BDR25DRAFT_363572 [Lindgomyces ingoldianus]KAF2462730.1 hypothetical protein BDR25DRAFT_363572 [Lindgomyces ingoldianus]